MVSGGAEFVPTKFWPELHEPKTAAQSLHLAYTKSVQHEAFTSGTPAGAATVSAFFLVSKNFESSAQPPPASCDKDHATEKSLHVSGGVTQHISLYLAELRVLPSALSGGAEFVPTKFWPESHEPKTAAQSLHSASTKSVQHAAFTSGTPAGAATVSAFFLVSKNFVSSAQPPPATCDKAHATEKSLQVSCSLQHVDVVQLDATTPAHFGVPS